MDTFRVRCLYLQLEISRSELHWRYIWEFLVLIWYLRGFPGGTSGKEPACQCRRCKRHKFDPWVRKIPWRRAWQPTPSCLKNPTDRGAWQAVVYRIAKSWTGLKQLTMQAHVRTRTHTHTHTHTHLVLKVIRQNRKGVKIKGRGQTPES